MNKNFKMASAAAAVAVAAMLTNMLPASAVAAGSGVSVGGSSITEQSTNRPPLPPCILAKSGATIDLTNTGTFTAQTQVYVGTTKMRFTASSTFNFGPTGIFGPTDTTCTGVPYAVPGSITVAHAAPTVAGTSVLCSGAATYRRVADTYEVTTAVVTTAPPAASTGNASCTVNGAAENSVLAFTGNQNPCFDGFFVRVPNCDPTGTGSPDVTEMQGVYTQTSRI